MIHFASVHASLGGRVVLDDVTLTVPAHTTLAVVGPSGAGKSSLLRTVAGLLAPSAGTVTVEGRAVTNATAGAVRRRLGYVVQEGGLFPHLRAAENIALAARDRGWPRVERERRVTELAELVRLTSDLLTRYPAELSGGQRQRVALARALALDPPVLLLDEPFAALDPAVRAELEDEVGKLAARLSKTVLLVTHDLGEAARLGSSMAVLREGRLEQVGTPAELAAHPRTDFVREFLRSPRHNGHAS
jgi:osmoprotectant transport system ATP-binding protein